MENYSCNFYFEDSNTNRKRLFQEALTNAKKGKVLYILKEELTELPELSQDLNTVSRHYMRMISFLYAINMDSLVESISTLPDWQNVPSTIILEDLNNYCELADLQKACGVVAMLLDSARSCSKSLSVPCHIHISITRSTVNETYHDTLLELYGSCTQ